MHGDEGATQSEVLTIGTRRITYIRRLRVESSRGVPRESHWFSRLNAGRRAHRLTKCLACAR